MTATLTAPKATAVEEEQRFLFKRLRWDQYVTISDALPEHRGLRMIFLDGSLQFLTKSLRHEWSVRTLDYIVALIASACEITIMPAGETTFRREDLDAGAEGDATFYFGENAGRMKGRRTVDLETDPPPDLAIEVEVSHPADVAMGVWGRLGVPEVWRVDAVNDRITFWLRREDGAYEQASQSQFLPMFLPADLVELLRLADEIGASPFLARVPVWARDVLMPRCGA